MVNKLFLAAALRSKASRRTKWPDGQKEPMYVYILHFDTPLSHAQHYVGMTGNLKQRLSAHASGHAAALTQELCREGLPWSLGGLFQTTATNARRVEKNLKESKNTSRYCNLCNPDGPSPPCSLKFPLSELPFPSRSSELTATPKEERRITIHQGFELTDQNFAAAIQRKHKVELGFLNHSALYAASSSGKLLIAEVNNKPAGFVIYTRFDNRLKLTIHQCAVMDEYRLMGVAKSTVDCLSAMHPGYSIWCKVRKDLPANFFWESIGFKKKTTVTHKTSKQELNLYYREWKKCNTYSEEKTEGGGQASDGAN